MRISKIRLFAATAVLAASAGGAAMIGAGPAMAAGCTGASGCESASVSVVSSITLTLKAPPDPAAPGEGTGNTSTTAGAFTFDPGANVSGGETVGPQFDSAANNACGGWATNGNDVAPSGSNSICSEQEADVVSQDASGYTLAVSAPDWSSATSATHIPISDESMELAMTGTTGFSVGNSGTYAGTPLAAGGGTAVMAATHAASGGGSGTAPDAWQQADQLAVPVTVGGGVFTTTITMMAVAS